MVDQVGNKLNRINLFGYGVLVLLFLVSLNARAEVFIPPQKAVTPTLFGLHIHRLASVTPWPAITFNSWSLVDAYVYWRDLQPTNKTWDFKKLDKYVLEANKKDVELLLPLAFPPQWASSRPDEAGPYGKGTAAEPLKNEDWRAFITMVGKRYNGRIIHFQVWDEPNEKVFFSGTKEKLLELVSTAYRTLKNINVNNKMVSPGLVGPSSFDWFDKYLSSGGAKYADIVGYHFYPPIGGCDKTAQRPESMIPLVKKVRSIMKKHGLSNRPLWNTGIGYWNENRDGTPENMAGVDARWIRLDQMRAAAWVSRTYILGWALGMERVFWYSWDHFNMGLIEPRRKSLKPSGQAYQTTHKWLVGSTMTYCSNDSYPLWLCELRRQNRRAYLVWRETGKAELNMPSSWNAKEVETLLEGKRRLPATAQIITIGEQPILIKSDQDSW